jgi:uncharacterized protein (AIM24 family)
MSHQYYYEGAAMQSHELDYEIVGDGMQMVLVELDPGETVIAEAGAMNYMEDGISFEARMGDGSAANEGLMGKLLAVGKRALTGESLFMTHFTHNGTGTVWIQSLPFSRMADRIIAHAPSSGGSAKGEGSVLGGIGRMLDGN